MTTAINRAHDLRIPFCHIQYREDGTIAAITPYYMEKLYKKETIQ
jgi:hypothetical protein